MSSSHTRRPERQGKRWPEPASSPSRPTRSYTNTTDVTVSLAEANLRPAPDLTIGESDAASARLNTKLAMAEDAGDRLPRSFVHLLV